MSIKAVIRSLRVVRRQAYMREMHTLGIPGGDARCLLGISINIWNQDVRATGLKFPSACKKRTAVGKARILAMVERRRSGETLRSIGADVGLTAERVRQLTAPHLSEHTQPLPPPPDHDLMAVAS